MASTALQKSSMNSKSYSRVADKFYFYLLPLNSLLEIMKEHIEAWKMD